VNLIRQQRASDRLHLLPLPQRDPALEAAISGDSVAIRFQPQLDARSGRLVGVEALARWHGALGSGELFDRAGSSGLSERLSRHVQRKALREAAGWGRGLGVVRLSLNCVAEDLQRPGYDDWLLAEIVDAGLDPARLTLEITESQVIDQWGAVRDRLERFRKAGIGIAVDDFGTGFANLSYLTELPLDALKIDRMLIAGIVDGAGNRIVVHKTIEMAHELGLKVVVEGIETPSQMNLVRAWGADIVQGYLISSALDSECLAAFARERA
jgi:EAL domain-containing protein (putative c-di-GMP-specific phosphodiesterase class I)